MTTYIDLTWMRTKYGGYNHYVNQIISNYRSNPKIKFIIEKKYEHFARNISTNQKIIITTEKDNHIPFKTVFNFFYRIIQLSKLQKQLKAPFLFPAWPGHIIKSEKILFIKHDICRITKPELFDDKVYSWSYWFWTIYGTIYTILCDSVGTVSESEKVMISKKLNINLKNIYVTYNYTDKNSTDKINLHRNRILFLGILVKRKNVNRLLELAEYIEKKNLDYELVIVGSKTAYWESISSGDSFKCINHRQDIGEDEKVRLFNTSYLIYPSDCEGFGIPVLEAVNHLCPVICNPLPVMKEILGSTGLYIDFSKNNAFEQLFKKINEIDNKYFNYFGRKRKKIMNKYTSERFVEQFDSLINSSSSN